MFHFIVYMRINSRSFAYDMAINANNKQEVLLKSKALLRKIQPISSFCSVHVIENTSSSFSSIKRLDPYFKKTSEVNSLNYLFHLIKDSEQLEASDVVAYLLRHFNLRNLRKQYFTVQKTLYYIYANFLCKFNKSFFNANFVAYKWGPVDQKSYEIQKNNVNWLMNNFNFEKKITHNNMSKDIIKIINETVNKYCRYYGNIWREGKGWNSNYNLTHKIGTPWRRAFKHGKNTPISDEDIKKYHKIEKIN